VKGHAIVTISLKEPGVTPGDCTAEQMDLVAELADRYGFGEIRLTHEQNLVLPQIRRVDLPVVWRALAAARLATANVKLASAIISCPGLDFCGLATARSIPVAQRLAVALAPREREIGDLQIKISGCINACGHHHVGHIGLLGVDKNGEEFYQITLGGSADENAALGAIVGPAVKSDEIVRSVDTIVDVYLKLRTDGERFPDTYRRVGNKPFKDALYAAH
jgi:sulfite reductase (NADPH) hemoprotein beta-component